MSENQTNIDSAKQENNTARRIFEAELSKDRDWRFTRRGKAVLSILATGTMLFGVNAVSQHKQDIANDQGREIVASQEAPGPITRLIQEEGVEYNPGTDKDTVVVGESFTLEQDQGVYEAAFANLPNEDDIQQAIADYNLNISSIDPTSPEGIATINISSREIGSFEQPGTELIFALGEVKSEEGSSSESVPVLMVKKVNND